MIDVTKVLGRLQARFGPLFEPRLERTLLAQGLDARLAAMMAYQFGFTDEHLNHTRIATGKRFRPLLAMLAAEAVGGRWQAAIDAGVAIELLHNFSLIHDDIEDRDPVRHHRPTVWSVWGEPQAINVGDAVFAAAFGSILTCSSDSALCLDLARQFQSTTLLLTEGQYLDMSFEERLDVSPDEYLLMIERKTAALVAFSLWSGAVLGGTSTRTRRALGEAGIALGKAFQIRDDIAGIWAEESETGKQASVDLVNRKKTLPVLMALARAEGRDLEALVAFLERRDDDVGTVRSILDALNIRRDVEASGATYLHAALQALEQADLRQQSRSDLVAMAVGLGS